MSNNGTEKIFHFSIEGGGQETLYDVTLNSGTGYAVTPVGNSSTPVRNKGSYTFAVNIEDGYKKGANFAVKVNGQEVALDDNNQYRITNITADQDVTVEDVVTSDTINQYNVTFTETDGVTYIPVDGYNSPVEEGNDYKFKVTVDLPYWKSTNYAVKDNGETIIADENDVYTLSNIQAHHAITVTGVTHTAMVTAPVGSTVKAGYENGEWTYYWYDPLAVNENDDGTAAYYFNPVTTGKPFFRVQNPNGTTYWNFESMAAGKAYTVTMNDLTKNGTFNSDTIYHDFVYNYLDLGDVYLTANNQGYIPLANGGTKSLNAFRNWSAIESFTNGMIAIPDFHYEVVDINGNPSNLVTVTTDQNNSGIFNLKASNSGTGIAIVKVTYDAMIHMDGYGAPGQDSGYGAGGEDPTRLGAIWPECTGVIVVSVGQNGTAPSMGMTINTDLPVAHAGKVAGDNIDAEHDLLYYYGDEGAKYTFKPETGSTVSIARCSVGSRDLSFSGFTTDGVETDDEGNVTVTGLTAGRHIVKVEKNGVANYQVLSARHVTIEVKNEGGEVISDWETHTFAPGETFSVKLHNVNSPQEKLAQCYNNSFSLAYFDETNKRMASTNDGTHGYGQYNFSSVDQVVTVPIPEDWITKHTYELRGAVALAGFSGTAAGGHRIKNYGGASGSATGTAGAGVLGELPHLTFMVNAKPHIIDDLPHTVTAPVEEGASYEADLSEIFTDPNGDDLTYTVSVDGADPVAADRDYSFQVSETGIYRLAFRANDGSAESDDVYTVVVKCGIGNVKPMRKANVEESIEKTIGQDGTYELDLSSIFEDADEDPLTYKVSVKGGDFVAAPQNYVFTPEAAGRVSLVFKANDGSDDSDDTFAVNLTVLGGTDPTIFWNSATDGQTWYPYTKTYGYVDKVSSSGARVKEYEWVNAETCNITLISQTDENAEFSFNVDMYTRIATAGVNINGTQYKGKASSTLTHTVPVTLNQGQASMTVQPYYSSRTGTLKTFNFTVEEPEGPAGQITSANVVLENDITMKLYATFAEEPDEGSISMNVTMNGEGTEIPGTLQSDGRYVFRYQDISPEYIGDEFDAVMTYAVNGEQFTDTLENYSVKKYCMKTLELLDQDKLTLPSTATEEETRILMVDTLFYGAEAQNYKDHNTDRLATSDLTDEEKALATEYVRPTADEGVISPLLTGTKDDNHYWYSASVMLDNSARLKLFFMAPNGIDGLTVTAGGEEREIKTTGTANKYYVEVTDIAADAFGERIETSFSVDGQATGQVLAYNINTYVSMTDEHATFGPMAQRLYNYGKSSKAYATA
ncbi:MAG: hypothetical protein IKF07_06775 [Eubacterium sp.]|nr:hypothetical protein [Eubacterium sp.]